MPTKLKNKVKADHIHEKIIKIENKLTEQETRTIINAYRENKGAKIFLNSCMTGLIPELTC